MLATQPCLADPTDPAALSPRLESEIADWLRAESEQHAHDTAKRIGRRTGSDYLRIYPLADYPAPDSIKHHIADGMRSRSRGTIEVDAGRIPSVASIEQRLSGRVRTPAELQERLSYAPADISATPLATATLISTEPAGAVDGNRSTGLTRVYRLQDGSLISLTEDDYIASKTTLSLVKESLNTAVNGTPAYTQAVRSKDGRGESQLRWVTPERSYWLSLASDDGAHIEHGQQLLMQIARQIGR